MKLLTLIPAVILTGLINLHAQQDIASARVMGSGVQRGDSVTVTGTLKDYISLLEVDQSDLQSYSSIQMTEAPALIMLSKTGFTLEWATDVKGSTEAYIGHTPELELPPLKLSGTTTGHTMKIDGLSPAKLFYIQAFSVHNEDTAKAALTVVITVSESDGTFRALFNSPVDRSVSLGLMDPEYFPDELDDELILYIDQAVESIDLALYNLNNSGISDITAALNAAHNRGVVVRAVYDGDVNAIDMQGLNAEIGKIASPHSDYPHYGIMHNKFVVIDAEASDPSLPVLWTGSTNFSYNQINTDPNNVIVIQDQSLARAFRLEFNEMFGSSGPQPDPALARFGPDKSDNTPHEFIIGGKRVECYFSPSDGTHHQILNSIESSDNSIHVATMLITKQDIGNALASCSDMGREVQVLINDYDQYGEPVVNTLKASLGEDVRLHGEAGILHHKYMIVDQVSAESDPLVLTGSHNWSESAQVRNDENTLIIHDQGLANAYYQEFVPRFRNGELLVSAGRYTRELQSKLGIALYPNPASEWIRIRTWKGKEIESITLIDAAGRVFLRYEDIVPSAIDISQIQEGLYLFHIVLKDGNVLQRKIIIQ